VSDFDQRLLTVKGWGVTLSLFALGLGFQYKAYGFFLVAAASSSAFWAIETAGKRHQMRHYVRMREIEESRCLRVEPRDKKELSSPRIDWSWAVAPDILRGTKTPDWDWVLPSGENWWYAHAWVMPHVALPHVITLLIGLGFFVAGCFGFLPGPFSLGSAAAR
jgi:hypothetical protein